ncbi:MAG: WG repeat-containing protein [Nonlabens sp.]
MKKLIHTLIIIISFTSIAQVPVERDLYIMEEEIIEVPQPETRRNNAGYYQENGKYGFALANGKRQTAIYDKIRYVSGGFIVQKEGNYGITDSQGVLLGKIKYDSVGVFNDSYLVKKKNKYGVLSKKGLTILPIRYRHILGANDDIAFIKDKKDEIQLISIASRKTLIRNIEYCELYKNIAIVKENGKFGLVGENLIIPTQYDSIAIEISKSPEAVRRMRKNANYIFSRRNNSNHIQEVILYDGDKMGLANSDGQVIYAPYNDKITKNYLNGVHIAIRNDTSSIYFKASNKKTEFKYNNVYSTDRKYITANLGNQAGAFDLKGNLVVPFKYDVRSIRYVENFGFQVTRDRKMGLIDFEGNTILPTRYDKIDSFYDSDFRDFKIVKSGGKSGVINNEGTFIVPIAYEWIGDEGQAFKVMDNETQRNFGLFNKEGDNIIPVKYQFISDTDTYNSSLLILKINDSTFNFVNKKYEKILDKNVQSYGYVLDNHRLNNPMSDNGQFIIYIKDDLGKMGLINAMTERLVAPLIYDEIIQSFTSRSHTYFGVRSGNKFGVINEKNEVIVPITYDDINLDLVDQPYGRDPDGRDNKVIVAKGNKYGVVDLNNQILVPFEFQSIERLTITGIYKVKRNKEGYRLMKEDGTLINQDYFDEVALYEFTGNFDNADMPIQHALTFKNGMMRVIDQNGTYKSRAVKMNPHEGYRTFDALKYALIEALQSKENVLLKDFVDKIAPSDHILYYLKKNIFNDQPLSYINQEYIKQRYLKEWEKYNYYRQYDPYAPSRTFPELTNVEDYTMYRDGKVTNMRTTDHAYGGDRQYMERFLRNAIKVNGYWISTYFMKRQFN